MLASMDFLRSARLPYSSIDTANSLRRAWAKKKEREYMREFLLDILRQLLGLSKPRSGRIELTRRATTEMLNNGLYPEIIAETFRNGVEIRTEVIVPKYPNFIAGLYYKYDSIEDLYRITFVFKN